MLGTICTVIGSVVIATKVVVPTMEMIDNKLKITDTVVYAMEKTMRKLNKKKK